MSKHLQNLINRLSNLKHSKNYNEIINLATQIIESTKNNDVKSTALSERATAYSNKGEENLFLANADYMQAIKLTPELARAYHKLIASHKKKTNNFKNNNRLDPFILTKEIKNKNLQMQEMRKIIEPIKKDLKSTKNNWLLGSCIMTVCTAIIILCLTFYTSTRIDIYPLYIFLFAITAFIIRQYTNANESYIESINHITMTKKSHSQNH